MNSEALMGYLESSASTLDFDDYSALYNAIVNPDQAIQNLQNFLNNRS